MLFWQVSLSYQLTPVSGKGLGVERVSDWFIRAPSVLWHGDLEIGVLLDAKEKLFFSLPCSLIRQVMREEGSQ